MHSETEQLELFAQDAYTRFASPRAELLTALTNFVHTTDSHNDLDEEHRAFVIHGLLDFTSKLTLRFIAGQQKYGDSFIHTPKDALHEQEQEILDAFWYGHLARKQINDLLSSTPTSL